MSLPTVSPVTPHLPPQTGGGANCDVGPISTPITLRLLVAFIISFLVHLAAIYGIVIKPQLGLASNAVVINARITHTEGAIEPQVGIPPAAAMGLPAPEIPEDFPRNDPVSEQPETLSPNPPSEVASASQLPQIDIPLLVDPIYYSPKQLDVIPRAAAPINPRYPDAALAQKIQGAVTLAILIDESGTVDDVSVVRAQPEGYFEESALDAFRNARFTPAQTQGRTVKSKVTLTVRFEFEEAQGQ